MNDYNPSVTSRMKSSGYCKSFPVISVNREQSVGDDQAELEGGVKCTITLESLKRFKSSPP